MIGYVLGGEAGARLSNRLRPMATSALTTVLRKLKVGPLWRSEARGFGGVDGLGM